MASAAFMNAENNGFVLFRQFHGVDRNTARIGKEQRPGFPRFVFRRAKRQIQFGCFLDSISDRYRAFMRQKGIGKFVQAHIGFFVRIFAAFEQCNPQHIVVSTVAVFTVVQQTDPIPFFGKISPCPGDLEPGIISLW